MVPGSKGPVCRKHTRKGTVGRTSYLVTSKRDQRGMLGSVGKSSACFGNFHKRRIRLRKCRIGKAGWVPHGQELGRTSVTWGDHAEDREGLLKRGGLHWWLLEETPIKTPQKNKAWLCLHKSLFYLLHVTLKKIIKKSRFSFHSSQNFQKSPLFSAIPLIIKLYV